MRGSQRRYAIDISRVTIKQVRAPLTVNSARILEINVPLLSLHFLHRLEAPSALMKDADGIPTTYLNKASNYTIVVRDSSSSPPNDGLMMYRTTLRIEFDAEYQRQDPAAFWILRDRNKQLTTDEAHPNGETPSVPFIQCMEYRTTDHPEAMTNVRAAHQSGFSILWSANPFGSKQCTVVIRMNFLSTDFTHVQGVKGDALRLCIKTEAISAASEMSEQLPSLDHIAGYCRIKLFRSHGAERKMSNDMINAKKRIKGFEKQLSGSKINRALVEQDSAEPSNKRAEKGSAKRTRARLEDELTTKIMKWKSLCGSAQECTYFRPYDRHSPMEDQRAANWDVVASMPEEEAEYKPTSNLNSPTCPPSAMDVLSPESNPFHTSVSNDSGQGVADATSPQQGKRRTPMPRRSRRASVKLTRQVDHDQKATQSIPPLERSNSSVHGRKRCEIEAADLAGFPINISKFRQPGTENMKPTTIAERDTNTLPIIPTSHPDKCLSGHRGKTVCFYVQTVESASKSMISNLKSPHSRSTQDPFTAIYLASRTAKEFVAVLAKWRGLDPGLVGKCTWRTANGVDVFVDDDVVAYLEEGTEMGVQVVNGGREVGVKEEMGDGEGGSGCRSRGMVEIRIFF